jgi:arabinofuranosyltransferase
MRGRFLALPFLAALLLLTEARLVERLIAVRPSLARVGGLVLAAYMLIFPHTPVNTWLGFQDFSIQHGVADERGYYFDVCSLYAWLYSRPGEVFPDFEWSHIGRQIATNGIAYLENDFNGMLGFWAGVKPVIIDRFALTDPFLARLPVSDSKNWRIGHFKREVPDEYRLSIETGQNKFSDAATAALFDKIQLATCDPQLFTLKRLVAIVKLNCGIY